MGLYFRPPIRAGSMNPFREGYSLGAEHARVVSVKAWCPQDGGHEFETDDFNLYSHFDSACFEVRCPTHGWQDA